MENGRRKRWWLHQSLSTLYENLGESLVFETGDPKIILSDLAHKTGANKLYWNRCYEPLRIQRDKTIKKSLSHDTLEVKSFNGALLFEPHRVLKKMDHLIELGPI